MKGANGKVRGTTLFDFHKKAKIISSSDTDISYLYNVRKRLRLL